MKILLVLALLVAISYIGKIHLFRSRDSLSVYTGGVEFILLGLLLGSGLLIDFPQELIHDLFPFIHIELGWIGLLYGVQLDIKQLRRQSSVNWKVLLIESLFTLVIIFGVIWAALTSSSRFQPNHIIGISLVLASAASLSSPWTAGIIHNVFGERGKAIQRLRFLSGLDDGPGLLVFSALFFSLQVMGGSTHCSGFQVQ